MRKRRPCMVQKDDQYIFYMKFWLSHWQLKASNQSVPARILACSKKFTGIRFLREKLVYHNYQHGRKQQCE
ncbi:hypothetical protein EB796_011226 [Bugula neritina]|uniref:Uncharacterized protein n=1 Tax=Bugula neritina TaxID=10212 RepID=A0A7J7JYP1_BUGNE|nr:hypothetical protein EB796_011226 [Bugula neritina]